MTIIFQNKRLALRSRLEPGQESVENVQSLFNPRLFLRCCSLYQHFLAASLSTISRRLYQQYLRPRSSLSRTRAPTLIRSIVFKMLAVQVSIRKKNVREEVEATSTFKRHHIQRTNQLSIKSMLF